ncbi:hypothetical protein [Arcobacter sp. FWKO B]|uniref:hypothetical protein n=1 Tax=Arcobacter sp. FWKO B TaxID=2593672 RepID=UPI0019052736|nr:hypothetical protein [Arcobacter sp. FWKO B]
MCLVISVVLIALGVSFYLDGNTTQSLIYFGISLPFLIVFAWRIKGYLKNKKSDF